MPSVSVIVPNYNHAPFLRQRIESILSQTYQDFELILLDDCSTDGSQALLKEYSTHPKVSHLLLNDTNSGSPFAQWARGLSLAQGKWVWIAESDDYAEPTFLEEMLQAAERHAPCSVIACTPVYLYPDGGRWSRQPDGRCAVHDGKNFVRNRLSVTNTLPNVSAMLIDRSALAHCDFALASTMRSCGDWLLYVDLCLENRVVELNRPLSVFRQHEDNTSLQADSTGLSLAEGCDILQYIATHICLPTSAYRQWGKRWAKMEQQQHYPSALRHRLRRLRWPSPLVTLWHDAYCIKYTCTLK